MKHSACSETGYHFGKTALPIQTTCLHSATSWLKLIYVAALSISVSQECVTAQYFTSFARWIAFMLISLFSCLDRASLCLLSILSKKVASLQSLPLRAWWRELSGRSMIISCMEWPWSQNMPKFATVERSFCVSRKIKYHKIRARSYLVAFNSIPNIKLSLIEKSVRVELINSLICWRFPAKYASMLIQIMPGST